MENAPIIPEVVDDDKDNKNEKDSKSKKKGRKGYGLGGFTFEIDKSDDKDKKDNSWFGLFEKGEGTKDDKKDSKSDKKEDADQVDKKPEQTPERSTETTDSISAEPSAENLEVVAPVEEISEAEAAEIRPKIVEAIETVEKDGESDPATDAPIEEFREIVKETGDADKAYEQVLSELDSSPEEAESVVGEETGEVPEELEADNVDSEPVDNVEAAGEMPTAAEDGELHEGDEILFNSSEPAIEASVEAGDAEEDTADSISTGAPTGRGASSAGGGARPPIIPPAPPYGPNFNFAPTPAGPNPNTAPKPQEPEYYYGASPAAMALFGGIIGYLIGRRRGRIKTEKKLIPVQKKLEKQVEDLRFDIQEKEKAIRRIAAEKIKSEGPAIIERFKQVERDRKERPSRIKAPEATELHGSNKHHERIGHVLINKETASEFKPNKSEIDKDKLETKKTQKTIEINRDVETLSRNELLEIGDKIIVNGTTLRRIYDSHLIGERGLRRLVHEHLRGGDMTKALKMEIAERELDFERDPLLRDMNPHQYSGGGGSPAKGGQAALEHLLKKADAALEDTSEEAAYYKARASYEANQYQKKQQKRQVLDVSLAVIITSLIAVILYLLITKF